MNIHFVSLNSKWIEEIQKVFHGIAVKASCANVETIPVQNTIFVSPANSLGFMDGGIDLVYSKKMFPGCQRTVQGKIKELGLTTALGRFYIPVGSACIVPTSSTSALICAPTMFLPHDVSQTKNAYYSAFAAFLQFKKIQNPEYKTIVLTSHCCGYGKMSEEQSALQMRQAYDDFIMGKYPEDTSKTQDVLLLPSRDDEQPDNYDNREIKVIDIKNLIR